MGDNTTTTIAEAIRKTFQPGLTKTFDQGSPFLKLIGWPFKENESGNTIDWKLNYSMDDASYINEGDTLPASSSTEYADCVLSGQVITSVIKMTNHARDAAKNGYFDAMKVLVDNANLALIRKCDAYAMAQLEAAIDDDATYAGQTRATVNSAADVTAGGSAALTEAMLSEMYETPTLTGRSVEYNPGDDVIISAPQQLTAYTELIGHIVTGDDEASGSNQPLNFNSNDSVLDIGRLKHMISYNRIPWYAVNTMTNTKILRLKLSEIIARQIHGVEVIHLPNNDDSKSLQLRAHIALGYKDPWRASMIEALTT